MALLYKFSLPLSSHKCRIFTVTKPNTWAAAFHCGNFENFWGHSEVLSVTQRKLQKGFHYKDSSLWSVTSLRKTKGPNQRVAVGGGMTKAYINDFEFLIFERHITHRDMKQSHLVFNTRNIISFKNEGIRNHPYRAEKKIRCGNIQNYSYSMSRQQKENRLIFWH